MKRALRALSTTLLVLLLATTPAQAQMTRADVETAYPTFGVSLTGPRGWVHLPGGRAGMISRWGKIDPQTAQVLAMVTAEVEPTDAASALQYAQSVALRSRGSIDPAPVDINGTKGHRVTMNAAEVSGLKPAGAVVVMRGRFAYVLAAFESPQNPAGDAMEAVRSAWRWLPVEPVVKHVAQLSPPFPAAGITVQVPAIARPFDVKDPASQTHLGVFDYVTGTPTLDIEIIRMPLAGDPTGVMQKIGQTVRQQLNVSDPLTWRDAGGSPRRWVSSSFDKTSPGRGRGRPPVVTVARYVLVQSNEREGALLTLQYITRTPGERATFEEANEAVVRSIKEGRSGEVGAADRGTGIASAPPAEPRGDGTIQITRKTPKKDKTAKP